MRMGEWVAMMNWPRPPPHPEPWKGRPSWLWGDRAASGSSKQIQPSRNQPALEQVQEGLPVGPGIRVLPVTTRPGRRWTLDGPPWPGSGPGGWRPSAPRSNLRSSASCSARRARQSFWKPKKSSARGKTLGGSVGSPEPGADVLASRRLGPASVGSRIQASAPHGGQIRCHRQALQQGGLSRSRSPPRTRLTGASRSRDPRTGSRGRRRGSLCREAKSGHQRGGSQMAHGHKVTTEDRGPRNSPPRDPPKTRAEIPRSGTSYISTNPAAFRTSR